MLKLRYVPIEEIRPWGANPKLHDVEGIKASIERYGFVTPVVINEETGELMAGHGRLKAVKELWLAGGSPPDRIQVENGEWKIPVIHGVSLEDIEAHAFALDDNLSTLAGGDLALQEQILAFNQEQLAVDIEELLEHQALPTFMPEFDTRQIIDEILGREAPEETFDVGAVLEAGLEPRIKRGEIWTLGDHRLMCGDATDAGDVARLLAGEALVLMVTDPPYGVQTDHSWRMARLGLPTRRGGQMIGDTNPDWEHAYYLWPAQIAFVWHSGLYSHTVRRGLENVGYEIRQQIVWVKRTQVMSRSHYHWKHEPCWYAVRKGKSANWQADRRQTTVWEFDSPIAATASAQGQDDGQTLHPTQKPLGVFEIPIRNHTQPGDLVADPFVGSGTAVIAAEIVRRRCVAMDIDPKWCEVAMLRWEAYTGRKAREVKA